MHPIQIGITDDHALFRQGVIELLSDEDDLEVILDVESAEALLDQLHFKQPEILLLDLNMKGKNGLEILPSIRQQYPSMGILVLSMREEPHIIMETIRAGANGFLHKNVDPEDLIAAIRSVKKNGFYHSPQVTKILMENMQNGDGAAEISLSEIELEVLRLSSEGKNAKEISEILYKSPRTIEGYRKRLMEKTHSPNLAALIAWGFRSGYL